VGGIDAVNAYFTFETTVTDALRARAAKFN